KEVLTQSGAAWRVRQETPGEDVVLGGLTEEEGYKAQITINASTAAVEKVLLSEYKHKVSDEKTGYPLLDICLGEKNRPIRSFELGRLKLKGRTEVFNLSGDCWQFSPEKTDEETVSFTAVIEDNEKQPVLKVIKTYRYGRQAGGYDLDFDVHLENMTQRSLAVESLELWGPMGLVREGPRTDRRQVVASYRVAEGEFETNRTDMRLLKKDPQKATVEKPKTGTIRWFAATNKYFAAVVRPHLQNGEQTVDYISDNQIEGRIFSLKPENEDQKLPSTIAARLLLAQEDPIGPSGRAEFNFKVFLGPIASDIFKQHYVGLQYEALLATRSCCTFCTFPWLTALVLKLMHGIYLGVRNYGVAIIILVLLVRLLLHPITKKSQMNMMRMQKLQPQIEELRKKYGSNKQELSKHTMALYKDHGMAGNFLLGCLPMLLQLPIWIALFTAVDGNVAIRHHGLFPASWFPDSWLWLTDLAAPDRLIPFSWFGVTEPIELPLLGGMVGGIDAFNILPILLTIAMFLQTKFTTQPQMAQANPQAAQQQKMMMYMMPAMMLLFFYAAPSGLNLYIMASTFGGLIEQKYIRKHIKADQAQAEAKEVKVSTTGKVGDRMGVKKKKPKPPKKFFS
ncbi:YidC/Oxa1 family insertase periplasmic-domain containing protein, partial [Planctomycetota bacterium]